MPRPTAQAPSDAHRDASAAAALRELRAVDDPEAVAALEKILAEGNPTVTREVVQVLGNIPVQQATQALVRISVLAPDRALRAAAAEQLRESFFRRMWDLSQFMKSLKQCFTRWYNAAHDCSGTLWEERFKSVLVEDGHAAKVMAAYIDLNAVRAGIVEDPKDYRWCGYAEAVAGRRRARPLEGLDPDHPAELLGPRPRQAAVTAKLLE